MKIPATFKEAAAMGYKVSDVKFQRGYVSRKSNIADAEIKVAGGTRRGQLYVLAPHAISTKYCLRFYLTKEVIE